MSSSSTNRLCKCGELAVVKTTRKAPNTGKRFLGYPFYDKELGIKGYGHFKWFPDEDASRSKEFIDDRASRLQFLKMENEEMHTDLEIVREDNKELIEMVKVIAENKQLKTLVKKVNQENKNLKRSEDNWMKQGEKQMLQLKIALVVIL